MTYESIETSLDSGAPVELYEFRYSGATYYYTTGPEPITRSGVEYTPAAIKRSSFRQASEVEKAPLEITAPYDLPPGELFRVTPPSEVVSLTIYRHHLTDAGGEFVVAWQGRVLQCDWSDSELTFTAESILTSLSRLGLRRRFSVQCPYQLYGAQCGVKAADHVVNTSVVSISGLSIQTSMTGFSAGDFAGGYVEWDLPQSASSEIRFISSNDGSGLIKVSTPIVNLSVNTALRVYPGCDHTFPTCKGKFSNPENFGGFPFTSEKNPFGGNPIY